MEKTIADQIADLRYKARKVRLAAFRLIEQGRVADGLGALNEQKGLLISIATLEGQLLVEAAAQVREMENRSAGIRQTPWPYDVTKPANYGNVPGQVVKGQEVRNGQGWDTDDESQIKY